MSRAVCLLLVFAFAAPFQASAKRESKQEKSDAAHQAEIAAAQKAAEGWLAIQDKEDYDASWKAAATFFQQNVPEAAWTRRMNSVRKSRDPVLTRTLNTADYKTELSGLPRGIYVALVWETVFRNGDPTLESVVMTSENGQWKMIGYAAQ